MQNALYLEINIIGLCLLLAVLFNQHQAVGSSSLQRHFSRLVYATIIMLLIDTACWLLDGTTFPYARTANTIIETLYFFFNILIPFLWVSYVEIALSKNQRVTRRRLEMLAIPLVILCTLLFVNLRTETVFSIDENNIYHRNHGFLAYAVLSYLYLGYASLRTFAAARHAGWSEDKKHYTTMSLFVILPAVGGFIQILFFGVTLIWVFVAISILLMYIDSLNRQISTDPLTGINNRRELTKYLMREMRDPSGQSLLALIMMDVDNFKCVNDTYGHYYGDYILVSVSDILKVSCQDTLAFLARYGGDEFCIVYPAETLQAVDAMVETIQANISRWNREHQEPIALGLSIGYALWDSESGCNAEALYNQADQQMYQVKNAKKAQAVSCK